MGRRRGRLLEYPRYLDHERVHVRDEPSERTFPEWGRRVHVIIQPLDSANPPSESDLDKLCREHLAAYKVPKTYEYLPELPRNAAGKIRRSALVEERADR